jgi:hypothetical protein
MKTLRSLVVLVLVLGTLTIPSLAQESEIDAGELAGGMSAQLREIVYGRDGFSKSARSSDTSEGLPLNVWRAVNGRDGFDFYASASQRPEAVVNGMSADLWGVIASRTGFALYAADTSAEGPSELVVSRPSAVPVALWQIIRGRDGFGLSSECAVC